MISAALQIVLAMKDKETATPTLIVLVTLCVAQTTALEVDLVALMTAADDQAVLQAIFTFITPGNVTSLLVEGLHGQLPEQHVKEMEVILPPSPIDRQMPSSQP